MLHAAHAALNTKYNALRITYEASERRKKAELVKNAEKPEEVQRKVCRRHL